MLLIQLILSQNSQKGGLIPLYSLNLSAQRQLDCLTNEIYKEQPFSSAFDFSDAEKRVAAYKGMKICDRGNAEIRGMLAEFKTKFFDKYGREPDASLIWQKCAISIAEFCVVYIQRHKQFDFTVESCMNKGSFNVAFMILYTHPDGSIIRRVLRVAQSKMRVDDSGDRLYRSVVETQKLVDFIMVLTAPEGSSLMGGKSSTVDIVIDLPFLSNSSFNSFSSVHPITRIKHESESVPLTVKTDGNIGQRNRIRQTLHDPNPSEPFNSFKSDFNYLMPDYVSEETYPKPVNKGMKASMFLPTIYESIYSAETFNFNYEVVTSWAIMKEYMNVNFNDTTYITIPDGMKQAFEGYNTSNYKLNYIYSLKRIFDELINQNLYYYDWKYQNVMYDPDTQNFVLVDFDLPAFATGCCTYELVKYLFEREFRFLSIANCDDDDVVHEACKNISTVSVILDMINYYNARSKDNYNNGFRNFNRNAGHTPVQIARFRTVQHNYYVTKYNLIANDVHEGCDACKKIIHDMVEGCDFAKQFFTKFVTS